jgi:glycosyltransferase involved in cell wall biosynthesis
VSAGVSVVMPVYNVGAYVEAAIASVLAQEGVALELIVVNDGSTDDTGERIRRVTDPRLRLFDQANSGRPSVARNRGIREARYPLVAFLDGDDVYLPGRLRRALDVAEARPDIDMVFHDVARMDQDGTLRAGSYLDEHGFPAQARPYLETIGPRLYAGSARFYAYVSAFFSPFMMSAILLRRSVLDTEPVWFREDMRCGEDVDLWLRLTQRARVVYIDEPLSAYRYRPDSTSRDTRDYLSGTLRAHEANLARATPTLTEMERRRYVRRISDRHLHLAYAERLAGRPGAARASCRRSFAWRPSAQAVTLYMKTFLPLRPQARSAS